MRRTADPFPGGSIPSLGFGYGTEPNVRSPPAASAGESGDSWIPRAVAAERAQRRNATDTRADLLPVRGASRGARKPVPLGGAYLVYRPHSEAAQGAWMEEDES